MLNSKPDDNGKTRTKIGTQNFMAALIRATHLHFDEET